MLTEECIGKKYGMLTIVGIEPDMVCKSGSSHRMVRCICDCGKEHVASYDHIVAGKTKSCGCQMGKRKRIRYPGEVKTRLYRIWGNMVNRCTNKNNPAYQNYGGRGITVCNEWRSWDNFKAWAFENGYNDDLTIDRIDNDSGYSAENCRFVDRHTQANNKRSNRIIEYNGESHTMSEWGNILGIEYCVLASRIEKGWSIERAFNQPVRASRVANTKVDQK